MDTSDQAQRDYDFWDEGICADKIRALEGCRRLNDVDPADLF